MISKSSLGVGWCLKSLLLPISTSMIHDKRSPGIKMQNFTPGPYVCCPGHKGPDPASVSCCWQDAATAGEGRGSCQHLRAQGADLHSWNWQLALAGEGWIWTESWLGYTGHMDANTYMCAVWPIWQVKSTKKVKLCLPIIGHPLWWKGFINEYLMAREECKEGGEGRSEGHLNNRIFVIPDTKRHPK